MQYLISGVCLLHKPPDSFHISTLVSTTPEFQNTLPFLPEKRSYALFPRKWMGTHNALGRTLCVEFTINFRSAFQLKSAPTTSDLPGIYLRVYHRSLSQLSLSVVFFLFFFFFFFLHRVLSFFLAYWWPKDKATKQILCSAFSSHLLVSRFGGL